MTKTATIIPFPYRARPRIRVVPRQPQPINVGPELRAYLRGMAGAKTKGRR